MPVLAKSHKYGFLSGVKTTLEISDPIYRQLKATAHQQGKTVRALVNAALVEKLHALGGRTSGTPTWRRAFGGLRHLRKETLAVNAVIAAEFSRIDQAGW